MRDARASHSPAHSRPLFVRTRPPLGVGVRIIPASPTGWLIFLGGLAGVLAVSIPSAIYLASSDRPVLGMAAWLLGFAMLMAVYVGVMARLSAPSERLKAKERT